MKNKFTRFAGLGLAFFLALLTAPAFALAAPAALPVGDLLTQENIGALGGIVLAVLELVVRLKPTDKDYSLVNKLIQVIQFLLPANRAKTSSGTGVFKLINFKRKA